MMKQLVREYSLPLDSPMMVDIHKKLSREESTGRKINFSAGAVLQMPSSKYAKIAYLFTYRGIMFACCLVFDTAVVKDFLIHASHGSTTIKQIVPLDRLSRPLVTAVDQ